MMDASRRERTEADELGRQAALDRCSVWQTPPEEVFDRLLRSASEVCGVPIAVLSFVSGDRQWFKSKVGIGISETPRSEAFCSHTVEARRLFVVEDASSLDEFCEMPMVVGSEAVRFYAGAPVFTSDGHAIGAVAVMDRRPRQIEENEATMLEIMSRQVSLELELRQTRRALGGSGDRLRAIVDAVDLPVMVTRLSDGVVLFANPAVEKALNVPLGSLVDQPAPDFYQDPSEREEILRDLEKHGHLRDRHLAFRRADGTPRWASLSARKLDLEGQPVIVSGVTDITDLKEAQGRIKLLSAALEQSDDLALITDRDGRIEYVNPSWCTATGYHSDEVIGHDPRIVKSAEQNAEFYEEMWNTILAGRVWRGRITNRKKDGGFFHEQKTITPIKDAQQNITHFLSTAKDVTEEVRLEAQLNQAQKLEAVGRLAGGVAHDFNNLLTVILGHLALAMEDWRGSPASNHLHEAREAGLKAADLTSQLLAFSRRDELDTSILDVNEVIEEVHRMLGRVIGEDIHMTLNLAPVPTWVRANRGQMGQVLMNLAVNARDAMPRGGHLTIESALVNVDGILAVQQNLEPTAHVMVAVTDDGVGMDEEAREQAFDPFFTTKDADRGTGLGLATVYGIITQSGGAVWIDSQPGLGTTVTFMLPLAEAPSDGDDYEGAGPWLGGTGRILVVEDDAPVRTLVAEILERVGYTVMIADSSESAVELCRVEGRTPDLLITDIVLSGLSGVDLSARFAADYPSTRLLLMSGYGRRTMGREHVEESGLPCLAKPFTPIGLLAAVRDVLALA